jgi:hypothetical protein
MKTTKTISINGIVFALPEGMSAKDVQALAGFLCTLTQLGNDYNYDSSEYMYYVNEGVSIKVADQELMDKAAARELATESYKRYKAKRDAEKAAENGDLIAKHVAES